MNTTQNRLLQTITDSIPERISSSSPAGFAFDQSASTSMPAESSSNWLFIFLFVIGLAFLGVNLVAYLAEGTQIFADITVPLAAWFARTFGTAALETTGQTVKASSAGAKDAIDIAADTTLAGVGAIQQTTGLTPGNKGTKPPGQNANLRQYADTNQMTGINAGKRVGQQVSTLDEEVSTMDSLTKALQNSVQNMMEGSAPYSADDTTSSVQLKAKAGWCLVGEEKGARNCIEVGVNDQCMSGDIFPTHAVCVNPRLRA
jgi:hypothetical protein